MKFAAQVFAFCVSGLLASIVSSPAQAAYTTLYDNTATFSGAGYAGGGATTIGNSISTTMVADDITAGAGLGGRSVDQFSFSVGNFNSTAVTASATVYFYNADPTTASPSTLITSLTFTPITFTAGVVQVFTYSSPTSLFTMPTGLFWAGISFSNLGGTTSATAAQLNNLGQGLYDPPSVGSSQDAFFQANSATTNGAANPAGGFYYFGGSPHANFGWNFSSLSPAAVPEPSSIILSSLAFVAIAGGTRLRRGFRARSAA